MNLFKTIHMDDWEKLLLMLKLLLVLVPVIITVSNSKLVSSCDEIFEPDTLGFISIDCGATADYMDDETGLFYVSDTKCMDTGEIHGIDTLDLNYKGHQQQRKNLRSFPQGTRNCYTLKLKQGEKNKYLIRAIFEYGIYDRKNKIPVFDLYLDVNRVAIVNMSLVYEIIHVSSMEYLDICLVNTKQGVPFISVLELRPLDNSIYGTQNGALHFIMRYDVGGTNNLRYPVDAYDRLWFPLSFDNGVVTSTESTIYTQSTDEGYKVPEKVLQTAVKSQNASIPLSLHFNPPSAEFRCYVYLYFAEIEKLEGKLQRELIIDLNAERFLSESVKLDYLKTKIIAQYDPPINGSRLYFSINSVKESNLPPILNAVEVYALVELKLSPTNLDDVKAIKNIRSSYKVTKNWQGDPCVPSNLSWDGLLCSTDTIPRITSLNLSSSNLTGKITTSFWNLQAITHLDLSYNGLNGTIPDFSAHLPNLKVLNLTGNKFTGSVPASLMQKSKDRTLLLSLEENPGLRLSGSRHKRKKFIIPIVLFCIGVLLILFAFVILAQYRRKKKRGMATGYQKESSLKLRNQPFTYSEIVSITNEFKTVIGEGGFGKVYYGTLKDKTEVAVKVLSPSSRQGYKEFQVEAELLMLVYHQNLVFLIGYCDDQENKMLIYEYMMNGNLGRHLSRTNTDKLSWIDRLRIAIDAANGLDYLHNGCKPSIIHRDLKPSNILLTKEMKAKIADFGLSRVVKEELAFQSITCPVGTPGYVDPEFHAGGILNKKSDIFSFGIILFELLTGHPAIEVGSKGNIHILEWVTPEIEKGDIQMVVDPQLQGEININVAWKFADIAMSCARPTAVQRPDINNVLVELKECLAIEVASESTTESSNTTTNYLLEQTFLDDIIEMGPNAR